MSYPEITGQFAKSGDWFVIVFLIPFQIIGVLSVVYVLYMLLGMLSPRPILTLGSASVPLGGVLTVHWKMSRDTARLKRLRIVLAGREEAHDQPATASHIDKRTFYRAPLIDTTDRMRVQEGMASITIPANAMHTSVADDRKVTWSLTVLGDIRGWPDVYDTFEIVVRPR